MHITIKQHKLTQMLLPQINLSGTTEIPQDSDCTALSIAKRPFPFFLSNNSVQQIQ